MSGDISYSLPVSILHGFVGHQLQQRTALIEVVNLLLEFVECLPLLQSFRQLSTPGEIYDFVRLVSVV